MKNWDVDESRLLISMQGILDCPCHMIWSLVVESKIGELCLGIKDDSGHALQ